MLYGYTYENYLIQTIPPTDRSASVIPISRELAIRIDVSNRFSFHRLFFDNESLRSYCNRFLFIIINNDRYDTEKI